MIIFNEFQRSRCLRRDKDDKGSMAILLMVVLVGMMLGALMVPMVITQARTTRFDITRIQALNAAQAGIDVALGAIRAGVTIPINETVTIGDPSKLPCGPLVGDVNTSGIAGSYSVVIEYFLLDPELNPAAAAMKCVASYGTFDLPSGKTTPGFARFTSTGTVGAAVNGSSAGRTVISTYVFRTSNVNLLGGTVRISPTVAVDLCLDTGTALEGAAVSLQLCSTSTPPAARQVFAYRTDLTLQLVASVTLANSDGLCLSSSGTPAVDGNTALLRRCAAAGQPTTYTQQWSYNDNGKYQAAQADSATTGTLPDLCLTAAGQSAGQPVIVKTCGASGSWIPSTSVGSGAAEVTQSGTNTKQLVNYNEFGRCLDVTNQDPNHSYLIDYPCKQNPYPQAVKWNQLFEAPVIPAGQTSVTGPISTYDTANNQTYCLTRPATSGGNVVVQLCNGGALQTWTIYNGDKSLSYSAKYTVVSGALCLGLSGTNTAGAPWSVIDAKTCSGSTTQKWNAVANLLVSTQRNTYEK